MNKRRKLVGKLNKGQTTLLRFLTRDPVPQVTPVPVSDTPDLTSTGSSALSRDHSTTLHVKKHRFKPRWVHEPEFYCKEFAMSYFHVLNDGVICSICQLCQNSQKGNYGAFRNEPAYPTRKDVLRDHLLTQQHCDAMLSLRLQRSSTLYRDHLDRESKLDETVAQRVKTVYWIVKQEIANRKLESLQKLIDDVGQNERLRDFKHFSSTACLEFINLISGFFSDQITASVKESEAWSTMVDESTDVKVFSQYITFVQYVDNVGRVYVKFLDIRRLSAEGTTSANLLKTFKQVAADYDLDLANHVAISCDGAPAMLGRHNGMAKQLEDEIGSMISVHCHAHRLALAAGDAMDLPQLKAIKTTERVLIQVWKYFATSAVRTAKLADLQKVHPTKQRQLQRTCKTRWLSSQAAVAAGLSEIISVWACLTYFAEEKNDAIAHGLLLAVKSRNYLFALYVLNAALPYLCTLSKIFQTGDLNFAQIDTSIRTCKLQLLALGEDEVPWENVCHDWPRFTAVLGPLTEADEEQVSMLTMCYIGETLKHIDARFPEPKLLSCFKIFDPAQVPQDRQLRKKYGNKELQILLDRYGTKISPRCVEQAEEEWALFREKLIVEFENCRGAAEVCQRLIRSTVYSTFSVLVALARIALTIPLSTAWPERGFSAMKRVKTRQRNRMSGSTLCALLNISMNGPDQLADEDALSVARIWKDSKKRRRVFERSAALDKTDEDEDGDVDFDDGVDDVDDSDDIDDLVADMDSFWL